MAYPEPRGSGQRGDGYDHGSVVLAAAHRCPQDRPVPGFPVPVGALSQRRNSPGDGGATSLSGNTLASPVSSIPRWPASKPLATERRSSVGCRSRSSNRFALDSPGQFARTDPPATAPPGDEGASRGAVVGTAGTVGAHGPAELGDDEHASLAPGLVAERGLERDQANVELAQGRR